MRGEKERLVDENMRKRLGHSCRLLFRQNRCACLVYADLPAMEGAILHDAGKNVQPSDWS